MKTSALFSAIFGDLLGPTDPQVRTALVYFSGADSLEEAVGLIPAHGKLFIWKYFLNSFLW